MTIKMQTLINAVPALRKLLDFPADMETSRTVWYKMEDHLKKHVDFYNSQVPRCQGNPTAAAELLALDVDVGEPVSIPYPEGLRMSYNEIASLRGIIDIQFPENEKKEE